MNQTLIVVVVIIAVFGFLAFKMWLDYKRQMKGGKSENDGNLQH